MSNCGTHVSLTSSASASTLPASRTGAPSSRAPAGCCRRSIVTAGPPRGVGSDTAGRRLSLCPSRRPTMLGQTLPAALRASAVPPPILTQGQRHLASGGAAAAPPVLPLRRMGMARLIPGASIARRGSFGIARFFREGHEQDIVTGDAASGAPAAAAAAAAAAASSAAGHKAKGDRPPVPGGGGPVSPASSSATGEHGSAPAPPPPPSPPEQQEREEQQGNVVPFVASTRQHHHSQQPPHHHQQQPGRHPDATRRHGAHLRREEELLQAAETQAVGAHPDILNEDLAEEAMVPYDAEGGLQGSDGLPAAAPPDAGTALGHPSVGAGPHAGLAVEDVDPGSGGFTASRPGVDPAYDDVGRAIREETGPHAHHHHPPSMLAAEAVARKAATADDIRESVLDFAPELQDVYGAFGGGGEAGRGAAGGAMVGDDQFEALLESSPLGVEGAVLSDAAAVTLAPEDPLSPPLEPPREALRSAALGTEVDLLEHLDTLAHLDALEQLEERTAAAADIADVMPSPLPRPTSTAATMGPAPAPAAAAAAGEQETSSGGAASRKGRLRGGASGRGAAGAAARSSVRVRAHASRQRSSSAPSAPSTSSGKSPAAGRIAHTPVSPNGTLPFYRTSPDVPDEDLEQPQSQARPPSPATAAAAAARRGNPAAGAPTGSGDDAGSSDDVAGQEAGRRGGHGGVRAYELLKTSVYGNSPDVQDEDLECTKEEPPAAAAATNAAADGGSPPPAPSPANGGSSTGEGRRLKSLSDVDRQFIEMDAASDWEEQARDLREAMQRTAASRPNRSSPPPPPLRKVTPPPGARGASSSLQPQTIGIHGGNGGGGGGAAATAGRVSGDAGGAIGGVGDVSGGGGDASAAPNAAATASIGGGGDGRAVTVLRVESVPSQTYGGLFRTAAVLAADGQWTLLTRPMGPSPERVRAAIQLLRMAPGTRDFRDSAAAAAAAADDNDERAAAETEAAVVAAVAAATGTPGMEVEAQLRTAASVSASPPGSPLSSVDERDLEENLPGLVLGRTEINPDDVWADPSFSIDATGMWTDPHDPHATTPMSDGEERLIGPMGEDYDEVMGQIADAQRSGWSEDAVNGAFNSDVY